MKEIKEMDIQESWLYLTKSREMFCAACDSLNKEYTNAAASRLYYAIFLAFKEIDPAKIKHGLVPEKIQNITGNLTDRMTVEKAYQLREKADYKKVSVRNAEICGIIKQVTRVIVKLKEYYEQRTTAS